MTAAAPPKTVTAIPGSGGEIQNQTQHATVPKIRSHDVK
jgi:hypothetical protein